MRIKMILILFLSFGLFFSSNQSILALPHQGKTHLHNDVTKGKDSIEWVVLWGFPQTREDQLERMLTTELQRRTLFALQEKKYLKAGKEHVYSFDPFKVTDMRKVDGGFYELDVLASVHRVIESEIDKKPEKYQITFRHNYDLGFVVTGCQKLAE